MVTVVVPVYNSAPMLESLVQRVHDALPNVEHEIILVNDGSADTSWARISGIAEGDQRVRGLNMARNYGQHNALLAGIRSARGDVVVTIDDDGQNPPEEIPKVLAALGDGIDLVYGTPLRKQHGILRNAGSTVTKLALRPAMGSDVARKVTAFRAFRTDLRDAFAMFEAPFVSIDALLSWGTPRIESVPVEHREREQGRSSYSFTKLATHALTQLTGFSTRPLRIASLIGLASTVFGAGILVLVLVRYFTSGTHVPGFAFLAAVIAILSGAQLLTLGVMGEYVARMHERAMNRPAYVIRNEVGGGDDRRD
jgi:undecaprenyl-phosphate 4-deoxy-4-formamido-L-arabinose transferase